MTAPHILTHVDDEHGRHFVDPELGVLLLAVDAELCAAAPNLVALHTSLDRLFRFLSEIGRTHANCWAADSFFLDDKRWASSLAQLPAAYESLLQAIPGIHDTVSAPEVAQNFGCTPEALLEQLYAIDLERPAV